MPFKLVKLGEPKAPESVPEGSDYGILRGAARTVARAGETVLGLAADIPVIAQKAADLISPAYIPKSGEQPSLQGFLNPERVPERSIENYAGLLPGAGAQKIRELHEPYTGEYTKPRTAGEEFYDNIIDTATTLLLPGLGELGAAAKTGTVAKLSLPTAKATAGALGLGLLGETSKVGAKSLGFGETGQAVAKFGALALGSTYGTRALLKEKVKADYKEAKSLVKDATYRTPELKSAIRERISDLELGSLTDEKAPVYKIAKDLNNKIDRNGFIKMKELIQFKQDINDEIGKSSYSSYTKKLMNELNEPVREAIKDYGKLNPQFGKAWNGAEELWKGLNLGNKATNFLKNNVNWESVKSSTIKGALGGYAFAQGGGNVLKKLPYAAAAGTIGTAVRETAKFMELIGRSPIARRTYIDLMKQSLEGNVKAVARDISKLDKEAQKNESSQGKFRLVRRGKENQNQSQSLVA